MEDITHQMLHRSFSTMALDSGASPKDVQGQIRHIAMAPLDSRLQRRQHLVAQS
jgi:hypothetical protein